MHMVLVLLTVAIGTAHAADAPRTEAAGLRFTVPSAWTRVPAASEMRAAQYKIPAAAGDHEDGELVLFYFGKGQGGGTQENIDRWLGQLTQPDGSATKDSAITTIRTVHGLKVTEVDAGGTYKGMGPSTEPKPGYHMLAAVVEGADGPWFFKAIGPKATIVAAKPEFEALVQSVEAHR